MASESGDAFQSEADEVDELSILGHPETRRRFIKRVAAFDQFVFCNIRIARQCADAHAFVGEFLDLREWQAVAGCGGKRSFQRNWKTSARSTDHAGQVDLIDNVTR